VFHHPDRHFTDYEERLLWSRADAPWGLPGLGFEDREAIRRQARREQQAALGRWLGAFWRGLTGRR
jgi:ADP-ribose pyrophosphatase YjhB (NUDIX family)